MTGKVVGQLQLGNLPNVWHSLDTLENETDRSDTHSTTDMGFTDRKFDEVSRTGQRMYIQARHFIQTARDNQKALEEMLASIGARPYAPWNLVRPAFESSLYAIWMLEPDNQRERLRRSLRIAWEEQRQHTARLKLIVKISGAAGHDDVLRAEARDREIKRRYEDEATVLNMSRKDLTAKVILTDEIPRLRSLTAMEGVHPDFHLLKWRELSGVQHGEMGAMNLLSDTNYGLKIPGGFTAVISLNDNSFVATCYSAAAMQMTAMSLYVQRSRAAAKAL